VCLQGDAGGTIVLMDGGNVLLDEKRNQLVGEAEFCEKNVM
jgi:hypothetical protein